jgi:uncharacterized protein YndB with AHSA1/START domain
VTATWGRGVELRQAPEAVWAFLTSETNDVNWRGPWVRSVRKLTDGPLGIGTRYETVYRFFGQLQAITVEITELEPARRLASRRLPSDLVVFDTGSYDLEAIEGGGTRFTVIGTYESRGWRRLIDAGFAWYLLHGPVQQQHAQLRAALDANAAPA